MFLPVYNLAQHRGTFWPGHEQKSDKYDVTQRNKTKYSICRRLDLRLKIYIQNVAHNHQSQEDLIENVCLNKFGVVWSI